MIAPHQADKILISSLINLHAEGNRSTLLQPLIDVTLGSNCFLWFQIRSVLRSFGKLFQWRTSIFCGLSLLLNVVILGWLAFLLVDPLDVTTATAHQKQQQLFLQLFGILFSLVN